MVGAAATELAGALVQLQFALNFYARSRMAAGELAAAAVLVEEERAIGQAMGNPAVGYVDLMLADEPARVLAEHETLGRYHLACEGVPELLFTENETNTERLWGVANPSPYVKDAFHEYVVHGQDGAVNPARTGTKAAAHYVLDIPPGGVRVVQLRLCRADAPALGTDEIDTVFASRIADANEFYASITPPSTTPDELPAWWTWLIFSTSG